MDAPIVQPVQQPIGQLNPANPFAQGLVGWWRMNEGAGKVVRDWSGQGKQGRILNIAPSDLWASAPTGKYCVDFPTQSTDDRIEIIGGGLLPNNMTVFARAQPGTVFEANRAIVYGRWYYSGKEGFNLYGRSDSFIFRAGDGANWTQVDYPFTVGTWYSIAVTYDGADVKMFVDGSLVDSNSDLSGPIEPGIRPFYIGNAAYYNSWEGGIEAAGLYNRALSASEIKQLYHNPDLPLYDPSSETPPAAKQQEGTYPPVRRVIGMNSKIVSARKHRGEQ